LLATEALVDAKISDEGKNDGRKKEDKASVLHTPTPGAPSIDYRQIFPEFLPNPRLEWRNRTREKLERMDMLKRRTQIELPEFYVGESRRLGKMKRKRKQKKKKHYAASEQTE
jgi:hypothetical protein